MEMASQSCWRCLLRPTFSRHVATRLPAASPDARLLSTSACLQAQPAKAKPRGGGQSPVKLKKSKSGMVKKNVPVKTGRPPAPGERKAVRKRIVLSNPNALEVAGMENLTAESFSEENIANLEGRMRGLPGEMVDQLRAVEAFKVAQRWGRFRRPGTLMTKDSVAMARSLRDVEGKDEPMRMIITGDKATGKSLLLLQAMAVAFARGWIVISIPDAYELAMAHTEYGPLPNSEPRTFVQRVYIANLLSQIQRANAGVLSSLTLSQEHDLSIPVQSNMSLDRFASLGASDPELSWPIYTALWRELTATSPARPPVLYCLDGLDHVMKATAYRDVDLNPIHAHDLTIVQHFIDHLSGTQSSLPNGGAILAATTASNYPSVPTLKLALRQNETASTPRLPPEESKDEAPVSSAQGVAFPDPNPYIPLDPRVLSVMENVPVKRLKGLDRDETRALLEYYASSGLMRQRIDQSKVAEMRALSGGGRAGEIERSVLGG